MGTAVKGGITLAIYIAIGITGAAFGQPKPLEPLVMNGGKGGNLQEHQFTFGLLANTGRSVEMRGACWSACTLITSYIPKDRLCFGEGSFLAFHSARRTR